MFKLLRNLVFFISFFIGFAQVPVIYAQQNPNNIIFKEDYVIPPNKILKQVLAPRYKNVFLSNISPNREYFLNYLRDEEFTPISQYAEPFYNLAGLEIDLKANRKMSLTNEYGEDTGIGLILTNANNGETKVIRTPNGTHLSHAKWSPDSKKIAFFVHFSGVTYIYVANVRTGKSKRLSKAPIMATINTDFAWSADGAYIFATLVPEDRGSRPQVLNVQRPQVRISSSDEKRLRTYLYLLQNPYEKELLEYYSRSQYAQIDVSNGKIRKIGDPSLISQIQPSPDGKFSLVKTLDTPFSYVIPVSNFGWTEEIWDSNGQVLDTVQKMEDNLGIPDHEIFEYKGRKNIEWRPDGNGLSFIQVEDTLNKKNSKIIQWHAPFYEKDKEILYKISDKISSVYYTEDSNHIIYSTDSKSHERSFFSVNLNNPDSTYSIYKFKRDNIFERTKRLQMKKAVSGLPVVTTSSDGKYIYFAGIKYNKTPQDSAPQPFIEKVHLFTGEKNRVFESSENSFERPIYILDDDASRIVISRETSKDFPNFFNLNVVDGKEVSLTSNMDYNPEITNAVRERLRIKRSDGFEFWITVLLPHDWNGKPLPALLWHYPTEYDNQDSYDKEANKYNRNAFPLIRLGWPERSEEILIESGYAVIEADWPIYSLRGKPNDAFIYSMRLNSAAIIDSVVSKGYVKRNQIAIGGHSYGGFGTINALTHTSYYKAGIAGDANSNRTLTPLGFQREKRDLWRGRDAYLEMSPILYADRMDGALLMYSGADDQNVGTAPFMSWQLFNALNALGKTVGLYMYPYAQHHTYAKEINLDRWARWINWLDYYVKGEK